MEADLGEGVGLGTRGRKEGLIALKGTSRRRMNEGGEAGGNELSEKGRQQVIKFEE